MRCLIYSEGSRGDVQPWVVLARRLQQEGFRVQIMTTPDQVEFVKGLGVDCVAATYAVEEELRTPKFLKSMLDGDVFQFFAAAKELGDAALPKYFCKQWAAFDAFAPELVLIGAAATPVPELWAEAQDVPAVTLMLAPILPSRSNGPLGLVNARVPFLNRMLFCALVKTLFDTKRANWRVANATMKEHGQGQLSRGSLEGLTRPDFVGTLRLFVDPCSPVVIALSLPVLGHTLPDYGPGHHFTGWLPMDAQTQVSRAQQGDARFGGGAAGREGMGALEAFLASGPAPVYLGWGSMIAVSGEHMASLAVGAAKQAGQRAVVLGGWAKLASDMVTDPGLVAYARDNVLFVPFAPHEWLFSQCGCLVSHGGSGTTAAMLRSGRPCIITPVFLDQHDFARHVTELGVGVGMKRFKDVTCDELAAAINRCPRDAAMRERAQTLGQKLRAEDGVGNAVAVLKAFVDGPVKSGAWLEEERRRRRQARRRERVPLLGCLAGLGWALRVGCGGRPPRPSPACAPAGAP